MSSLTPDDRSPHSWCRLPPNCVTRRLGIQSGPPIRSGTRGLREALMITGIAYIEMRTRFWDECREVYGKHLGLTELQNTTAVLKWVIAPRAGVVVVSRPFEKGEWVDSATSESGNREAILQVGDSFLVLHEDETAPMQVSPKGERMREAWRLDVGHCIHRSDAFLGRMQGGLRQTPRPDRAAEHHSGAQREGRMGRQRHIREWQPRGHLRLETPSSFCTRTRPRPCRCRPRARGCGRPGARSELVLLRRGQLPRLLI